MKRHALVAEILDAQACSEYVLASLIENQDLPDRGADNRPGRRPAVRERGRRRGRARQVEVEERAEGRRLVREQ